MKVLAAFSRAALTAISLASVVSTAHAAPIKIRVAEVVRAHLFDPMYVALAKGFALEEGLEVDLTTTFGGDKLGALLLTGQADIGLASTETPIYIYNSESPDKAKMFSALAGTDGLHLLSRRKIENFKWSDINGKSILGYNPGAGPQLTLEYVLKKHGVSKETISGITGNISRQARDSAWISGNGEFGIFIEPSASKMIKAGAAFPVTSMGEQLGRADSVVFIAMDTWLKKNPQIAQKWTNAIAKAQKWTQTASSRELAEAVAPYFPGLAMDDSIAVIERFRATGAPIWSATPEIDRDGLAKFQDIMVVGGTLPKEKVVPYDSIVTTQFMKSAISASGPK